MKKIAVGLLLLAGLDGWAQSDRSAVRGGFAVGNEDRVVIYGDSITDCYWLQAYPRYLETYIRTRYPDWKGEAWNRGEGGDEATNLRRYREECLSLSPTIVTFNMGMNGLSFDKDHARRLKDFVKGLEAVVAATRTNCPNARLFLCSPIPYEVRMKHDVAEKAVVLRTASREERRVAERLGVPFIDINRAMYENYGVAEAFAPGMTVYSNDGIHPGCQGGCLLMAVAFLEGMGAQPHLAAAEIDAVRGAVVAARDVTVGKVSMKDGTLSFERTLAHLPFPAVERLDDQGQPYADREIYGRFEIADRLNRDLLKVSGLTAEAYTLRIDGKDYEIYSREELAEGVNLGECCVTPDFVQACRLSDAVGAKHIAQNQERRGDFVKKNDVAKIAAAKREVARRVAEVVSLAHARPHRFELVPYAGKFERWNRYQETVLVTFEKYRAWYGCPMQAAADGHFRGNSPLTIENLSERPRRVEVIFPAGFTPAAIVKTLAPHEQYTETVAYDLEPEAPSAPIMVKHVRADGLSTPILQQINLQLSRRRTVTKGADGSIRAKFTLKAGEADDRSVRWLGPADSSGEVDFVWKNGVLSLELTALDQMHFNAYTDRRIGWDDSFNVSYGKQSFDVALTREGAKVWPQREGVKAEVTREGYRTIYRLSFPAEEPKGEVPLSLSILDRDFDQQSKLAVWRGTLSVH